MSLTSIAQPTQASSGFDRLLRTAKDEQLRNMAQQYKDKDTIAFSLITQEGMRRKEVRDAAQAEATRAQMGGAPTTVADQQIANMTPAPVAPAAPAMNAGIAQLNTPNIARMAEGGIAGYDDGGMAQGGMYDFAQRSEPVLRMADGGYVARYADTGSVNSPFEDALRTTLRYEGGYVENDAGRGPSKFGINKAANPDVDIKNLTKEQARELYKKRYWDAIGGDSLAAKDPALAKVAFDTAVNMGVNKAKQLVTESKGNPSALLQMRQQHYDKLIEADPKKFAPYKSGWQSRLADLATSVVPSAQAGTLPQQGAKTGDLASQIPGQSYTAPASNYDQTNSVFGRMADKLGIPLEAQRQISTTLNAPTPLAPAAALPKSGGMMSGLASLGEKLGDKLGLLQGPKGRMSAAEIAALQKQNGGLKTLEAAQQATKDAQAAGATLDEQEYIRKMMEARRAKEAADKYSKAAEIAQASQAREVGDVLTAQRLAQTGEKAQVAGRTNALMNAVAPASGATASDRPAVKADLDAFDREDAEMGAAMRAGEQTKVPDKNDILKATKEAVPAETLFGLGKQDVMMLGLQLMASKNPRMLGALGEAGIGTLAAKTAREKAQTEKEYTEAHKESMLASAARARAETDYLQSGAKGIGLVQKAADADYDNWLKAMQANPMLKMQLTPELAAQKRQEFLDKAYKMYKIEAPAGTSSAPTASSSDPLGILSKKG